MTSEPIRRVLSIAGSDSGGGAGIQADLKAFARCGVHGMTAITAITAQNTEAVATALDLIPDAPVVHDPVMVAESGGRLLDEDAQEALTTLLLPRAAVVTPNVPEARTLAGASGEGGPGGEAAADDSAQLAREVHALGPAAVVVTGGHRQQAVDVFFDGRQLVEIPGERYVDGAAHGSGCTHSSALAAHIALGLAPLEAARAAKQIASEAVRDGLRSVGAGPGPVDVFGGEARHGSAGTRPIGGDAIGERP